MGLQSRLLLERENRERENRERAADQKSHTKKTALGLDNTFNMAGGVVGPYRRVWQCAAFSPKVYIGDTMQV